MTKVEFYVGTQFKADKSRLTHEDLAAATAIAEPLLIAEFGGFSNSFLTGFYKDFPPEISAVMSVMGNEIPYHLAKRVAAELAIAFQQETVLFFLTEGFGSFVSAAEFSKEGAVAA